MAITKKEVEHIAALARLGLNNREKEKFTKELSSVLDYINQLSQLNVEKIEPMSGGTSNENITRQDDPTQDIADNQMKQEILNASPDRENDYFKVPQVLE